MVRSNKFYVRSMSDNICRSDARGKSTGVYGDVSIFSPTGKDEAEALALPVVSEAKVSNKQELSRDS